MAVLSLRPLFLSHLLFITIFTSQASANQSSPNFNYFCDQNNDSGNYTTNSTYHTNLNTLLSTLTSNTEINYGFYNFSYGENTDKVNAIGLCRGDVKPDKCRSCLNNSRILLTQNCPNRKEAIGWYDNADQCMLRYSNRSIFGLNEIGPAYFAWNTNNVTEVEQFNKAVNALLDGLKSKAASGDSRRKYAVASVAGPDDKTIYGLVQCTPDLSGPLCDICLNQSIAEITNCCNASIGARIVRPSCYLRFETSSLFYEPPADSPSPSPSPSKSPSPTPMLSSSPPPSANSTNSEDKASTSRTVIAIIPLLLSLCSFLFVSI